MASHGGLYNSCLGGPHSSFNALAEKVGGTARLLTHFLKGLEVYRQWGPPKITCVSMTDEEIDLARKFNANEGDLIEVTELIENEDGLEDEADLERCYFCCSHCNTNMTLGVAGDERVRNFQEIHESGLEVEYRYPKCRVLGLQDS